MLATIKALYTYPLKSAAGIPMQSMEIINSGPKWDREWMIIDKNQTFVTQRTQPKLCQIKPQLTSDNLLLDAPGMSQLKIPFTKREEKQISCKIWEGLTPGEWVNAESDQWLSDFLGQKFQLVRSPKNPSRLTSGRNGPKTEILFPDGYPLLLTAEETLQELNEKLNTPVPMNRFRPNIVISGAKAGEEDLWKQFKVNDVSFDSVKACTRCVIITINQDNASKNNEAMKALLKYRTKDGEVIFGSNLIQKNNGIIHVGDALQKI